MVQDYFRAVEAARARLSDYVRGNLGKLAEKRYQDIVDLGMVEDHSRGTYMIRSWFKFKGGKVERYWRGYSWVDDYDSPGTHWQEDSESKETIELAQIPFQSLSEESLVHLAEMTDNIISKIDAPIGI